MNCIFFIKSKSQLPSWIQAFLSQLLDLTFPKISRVHPSRQNCLHLKCHLMFFSKAFLLVLYKIYFFSYLRTQDLHVMSLKSYGKFGEKLSRLLWDWRLMKSLEKKWVVFRKISEEIGEFHGAGLAKGHIPWAKNWYRTYFLWYWRLM